MQIRSIHVSSGPAEGRSRSSRYVGPGCDGRCGVRRVLPQDEIAAAYGEVVWSWRRDRGVYFAGGYPADNGDKKRRSPGRARISRQPLRGESRDVSAVPVVVAHVLQRMGCPCASGARDLRAQSAPGFPCVLSSREEQRTGKTRANSGRGNEYVCFNVIGSGAKQSSFLPMKSWIASSLSLLAMTVGGTRAFTLRVSVPAG